MACVCTVVFRDSCFQPDCSHLSFYQSHRQGSFMQKKVGFGTCVVIHEGVILAQTMSWANVFYCLKKSEK